MEERRKSKRIKVGKIAIGDLSPIAIQSMTNTDTHDYEATLSTHITEGSENRKRLCLKMTLFKQIPMPSE